MSGMNLEDHVGDVVRKARTQSGCTVEAAARAAGLTVAQLEALEAAGSVAGEVNYAALGTAVGLTGPKVVALAQGWLPAPVDLSPWRELRVITTSQEGMAVNAYLVWDEVTREATLFDTGWEAQPIVALIEANQLQLKHLFLTHSHVDHVAALAPLRQRFPKMRLHSGSKHAPADQRIVANAFVHLGSLRISHRDTPGHAEDGVTYIVGNWSEDAPHVAIVGDAIFSGSIGGIKVNAAAARQVIRDQILSLPADTLLCPGHGPLTTVAQEKAHNPFF